MENIENLTSLNYSILTDKEIKTKYSINIISKDIENHRNVPTKNI